MEYLREGPLAQLWEAIAFKDSVTPESVSAIDVNATIDALRNTKEIPLPVAGELLHALSKVLDSSAEYALEDAKETNRELYNTFKDHISVNDGGEIDRTTSVVPPMETGLDLHNLSLPESLIGRRHQAAPEDVSIDAIMREDRPIPGGDPVEEAPQRSAEELEALEALDIGDGAGAIGDADDMFEFPTIPESDEGLEFGSDLQQSSSPPHTPSGDIDINVHIGTMSSPQGAHDVAQEVPRKRATRRHGAPVDEIISISRPTRPSAKILRPINEILAAENEERNDEEDVIPLDEATEKLVDPDYVQAEMKRRRVDTEIVSGTDSLSSNEGNKTLEAAMNENADDGIDFEADWDMETGDNYDDQPSPIASESDDQEEHEEDTAEVLIEGAAAAKAVLHSHLKKKGAVVMFDDIATSAQTRADTLMEVLTLAAKGRVQVHQDQAWGSIKITQV